MKLKIKRERLFRRFKMNLGRIMGLTIFCVGIILLLFGFTATQTLLESIVKWFAGYYTEHTMIVLIAGMAMAIGGGLLAFFRRA